MIIDRAMAALVMETIAQGHKNKKSLKAFFIRMKYIEAHPGQACHRILLKSSHLPRILFESVPWIPPGIFLTKNPNMKI